MSTLLWFRVNDRADIWHIVREDGDQTRTLCGIDVTDVDEMRDELGEHRPCDNCAEILARHADAGDQPALDSAGEPFEAPFGGPRIVVGPDTESVTS